MIAKIIIEEAGWPCHGFYLTKWGEILQLCKIGGGTAVPAAWKAFSFRYPEGFSPPDPSGTFAPRQKYPKTRQDPWSWTPSASPCGDTLFFCLFPQRGAPFSWQCQSEPARLLRLPTGSIGRFRCCAGSAWQWTCTDSRSGAAAASSRQDLWVAAEVRRTNEDAKTESNQVRRSENKQYIQGILKP